MPVTKIRELPERADSSGILDTDYMVIEDSGDTRKVSIRTLKILFSTIDRQSALAEEIRKEMQDIQKQIADSTEQFKDDIKKDVSTIVESLSLSLQNVSTKLDSTNQQANKNKLAIESLVETVNEHADSLTELATQLKEAQNTITELVKSRDQHDKDIESLKTDVSDHGTQISDIKKTLESLSTNLDDEVDRIEELIQKVDESERLYAEQLYNKIMKYIDYYHHIHEYPPNFDAPTSGDPMISVYVHPVGSIFQTQNADFNPNKYFPGTWEFVGSVDGYDESGELSITYYTHVKVSEEETIDG